MNEISGQQEFRVVTSRRNRKNIRASSVSASHSGGNEDIDQVAVLKRIKESELELRQSEYFRNFIGKLAKSVLADLAEEIICFGIGHFSDCLISRYQLAFILAIQRELKIENISFHEPILSGAEVGILRELQCEVAFENIEGKLAIGSSSRATILYAPHCPKQLINNFLWKNWSQANIEKLIYIGNSFSNILSSTPSRHLEVDAIYIVKINPRTEEIEIENNFRFTDIFNDTSIHLFPRDRLTGLNWSEKVDEPQYSDSIELITSEFVDKSNIRNGNEIVSSIAQ